jgi:hypothetical protein
MSAAEGLTSYGWWGNYRPEARASMRQWVRGVLLSRPGMTDAECDRFIASLGERKVDDLARRAFERRSATDF